MAGLLKEVWLAEIIEKIFPDDSFIKRSRDLSIFVENNKINMAKAGARPKVLINNSTYPVPTVQREDSNLIFELDTFDTENMLVRDMEAAELSYDKRQSVLKGSKDALRETFMKKLLDEYSPNADSKKTPLLQCTGSDNGSGRKKLTFEDLLRLRVAFNNAGVPANGRVLVLSAEHEGHLLAQDLTLFKTALSGSGFAGFQIYNSMDENLPNYNKDTGAKAAFGAAASTTDAVCSVAWQDSSVMTCLGTSKMFSDKDSPYERGDVTGFQVRALAKIIDDNGIGAIYSGAV